MPSDTDSRSDSTENKSGQKPSADAPLPTDNTLTDPDVTLDSQSFDAPGNNEQTILDATLDSNSLEAEEYGHGPNLTISEFIAIHGIEHSGVDLAASVPANKQVIDRRKAQLDRSASDLLDRHVTNRYGEGEVIGQGGMGQVISVKDLNIRRDVAMKIMTRDEDNPSTLLRFIEEAQITGQLEHPGIVPVYEMGINDEDQLYYTMKLVKGHTLKEIITALRRGDHKTIQDYPLTRLLALYLRILEAISYAHHKGVVHRDLKPDNIMVGEYGEVLVLDWGLARVIVDDAELDESDESRDPSSSSSRGGSSVESVRFENDDTDLTRDGQILGTPRFMAPEQSYNPRVDQRADVYSLGAILYDVLTLRHAIDGNNLTDLLMRLVKGKVTAPIDLKLRPNELPHCPEGKVPPGLSAVTMKAMAVEPQERYQTVQELREEIQAYLDGFATRAEGASKTRHAWLFVMRHKTEAALVLIAMTVLAATIAIFVNRVQEERDDAIIARTQAEQALITAQEQRALAEEQRQLAEEQKQLADEKRQEALEQRRLAEEQRQDALEQRQVAETEREEARYRAYVAGISQTQQLLQRGNLVDAAASLRQSPPSLRHWEWGYLARLHARAADAKQPLHDRATATLDIAHGGKYLVSAGDFESHVSLMDLDSGRIDRIPTEQMIVDVAISPAGQRLVMLDAEGQLYVRDRVNGGTRKLTNPEPGSPFPGSIAYSPGGELLAAHIQNKLRRELWVIDPATNSRIQKLMDLPKVWESALTYSPDGRYLASSSGSEVIVWEVSGRVYRQIRVLRGHSEFVFALAFSPDSRQLVSGGRDQNVLVWSMENLSAPPRTLAGHRQPVNALAFGNVSSQVISGGSDGLLIVWDISDGSQITQLRGGAVNALTIAANRDTIYVGYADGGLGTLSLAGLLADSLQTPTWRYSGFTWDQLAAFSPDSSRLLIADASAENPARLIDVTTQQATDWHGPRAVSAAAISPDSRQLLYAEPAGDLYLTSASPAPGQAPRYLAKHPGPVAAIAYSADARHAWTLGNNQLIRWTLADGAMVWQAEQPGNSLALAPDGRLMVGHRRGITWYDPATGKPAANWKMPEQVGAYSEAARLSADGRIICLIGERAVLLDAQTGAYIRHFPEQATTLKAVALSPDGRRLAIGGRQRGIQIWDTEAGEQILNLDAARHYVSSLAFSPDGRYLVSTDQSGRSILYPSADYSTPTAPPKPTADQPQAPKAE